MMWSNSGGAFTEVSNIFTATDSTLGNGNGPLFVFADFDGVRACLGPSWPAYHPRWCFLTGPLSLAVFRMATSTSPYPSTKLR